MNFKLLLAACFYTAMSFAQTPVDTTQKTEEEDFSMYADVVDAPTDNKKKIYCSQKIIGLSPSKLISLGFDYVAKNELESDTISTYLGHKSTFNRNTGVRFAANFPVISNTKMILSLGVSYLDFKYNKVSDSLSNIHPLTASLAQNGLRSYGVNATLFKPFNEKWFMVVQAGADQNNAGDLNLFHSNGLKINGAAIFGKKAHDRRQFGVGVTQSYRGGALNYFPVVMYNYTSQNKKWGIEMLLPARANVRYTVNARNLLFAGFELEGNSYYMNPMVTNYNLGYKNLQLHRSEIRPRLTYEFSVYNFIWMSVQAGYRLSYNFKVDDVDYKAEPAIMDNKLGGAPYFNISLNLVSP